MNSTQLVKVSEKVYIGREEAFEICLANGHDLPRRNKEFLHSRQIGLQSDLIGKDEQGYYIQEII